MESVDQSQSDVSRQHGLILVTDSRDDAVQNIRRAVATHALFLKLWLGLGLQVVDVRSLIELSKVDLRERVYLAAQRCNFVDNIDN